MVAVRQRREEFKPPAPKGEEGMINILENIAGFVLIVVVIVAIFISQFRKKEEVIIVLKGSRQFIIKRVPD